MEQANQISGRSRRSRQQILELLHDFQKSGTTVTDFCKRHKISTGNFHKWKSRYKSTQVTRNIRSGFAKLEVMEASQHLPVLFAEVSGSNGYRIRIYQSVSASFLKELLS